MAELSLFAAAAYASFGVLFAIAYCSLRLPPGSSFGLRLILLPGAFALWPILLLRWSSLRHDTTSTTRA